MNKTKKLTTFNIMNDAMFKALFRSTAARGMISSFLNAITGIDQQILQNALYISGEIPKTKIYEKGKVSDCIVIIDSKNRIIVEMNQFLSPFSFDKNASYAFSNLLEMTRPHMKLYPKIFLINIDNENKFHTKKPILSFKIQNEEGIIETEMYHSIHLILENIVNTEYNINEEIKKFSKFLKSTTLEELKKECKGDERYMAAFRKIEDLTYDPELAGQYDLEEAHKQDLYFSHLGGFQEGMKQGIQEEKRKSAKAMVEEKKKNAKAMLEENIPISVISKILGLSEKEIQKLEN